MSFIVRHGSTWHFRWRLGQSTFKVSLETGNKRKAGQIAIKLHTLMLRETKIIMNENQLRRALVQYRDALLRVDEQKRWSDSHPWPGVPLCHLRPDEPYNKTVHDELTLAIKNKDWGFLSGLGGQFKELTGIDIDGLPETEARKVRYLVAVELCKVMGIQRLRKNGNYDLVSTRLAAYNEGFTETSDLAEKVKLAIPLNDAITAWEQVLTEEGKQKVTLVKYLACLREFLEITGNLDLIDISKTHCRNYREALKKLPAKYKQKFPGKTIAQLLRMKHKPDTLCTPRSVNDKLSPVKLFFLWAVDQGHLDTSPMDGINSVKAPKNNRAVYAPFSMADIETMFGREYLAHTNKQAWHFWVPLLALFTGARQSELAQLKVSDAELIQDEIWCLQIRPDKAIDATVKTDAGTRMVPLHPFLINSLRFSEYVESRRKNGKIMLFDITRSKRGGHGKNLSKWFNQSFLKKITLEAAPAGTKKKFHSFRATTCTVLKHSRVPGRLASQVIGHIPPHVATDWIDSFSMTYDYYAGGYPLPDIYQEVTLKIEFGVNLDHLTLSPWTGPCDFSASTGTKERRKIKSKK